jgi:hypothetical protein
MKAHNDLAGVSIDERDFSAFANLCERDPTFPDSWANWRKLADASRQLSEQSGFHPPSIEMRPQHFRDWCLRLGIVPCMDAIRAYALAHRSPSEAAYGSTPLTSMFSDL